MLIILTFAIKNEVIAYVRIRLSEYFLLEEFLVSGSSSTVELKHFLFYVFI